MDELRFSSVIKTTAINLFYRIIEIFKSSDKKPTYPNNQSSTDKTLEGNNEISFLDDFIRQASTTNLKTKGLYPSNYNDLKLKVSFGMGTPTKIPWISFLGHGMTTSDGFYPVYLYYKKQNILVLAYGISETVRTINPWSSEIVNDNQAISDIIENPSRYGKSLVFKYYKPKLDREKIRYYSENIEVLRARLVNDLDLIINKYIEILRNHPNKQPKQQKEKEIGPKRTITRKQKKKTLLMWCTGCSKATTHITNIDIGKAGWVCELCNQLYDNN